MAGAGPPRAEQRAIADAVHAALSHLGARVHASELTADGEPLAEDRIDVQVAGALASGGRIDVLAVDAGGIFAGARAGSAGLRVCLESTWNVTRAVANTAFIPAGEGGRICYLGPPPGAGRHARACCAGLENLARTLSIEWARHEITPVAIAPGEHTDAAELAAITAYLASPAGAYFSGCLLDLRGPGSG